MGEEEALWSRRGTSGRGRGRGANGGISIGRRKRVVFFFFYSWMFLLVGRDPGAARDFGEPANQRGATAPPDSGGSHWSVDLFVHLHKPILPRHLFWTGRVYRVYTLEQMDDLHIISEVQVSLTMSSISSILHRHLPILSLVGTDIAGRVCD
ncbi:hypothetical protein BDV59DRAFT_100676 [Aspergillus ambiguus]|uniref:uncharacterized protein n=1 Tax=Aspergillus ambiguus TaxID=176160 RepID=UPI003CCD7F85